MSFLSKLMPKATSKSLTTEALQKEENKNNFTRKATSSKSKVKKAVEKERITAKINLCSVYNRNENYKPLYPSTGQPIGYQHLYEKEIPKFKQMVEEDSVVNLPVLQKLAWQGVPVEQRPAVWKILLQYVPLNKSSRESTVARKREEYASFVQMYVTDMKPDELDETDKKAYKLVGDDVRRTQPDYRLFHHPIMQEMMVRILWIWHVRHPASGYVQGINDLITPFLAVYLREHIDNLDFNSFDIPPKFDENLTKDVVSMVEADTYWCLCKILDGILDNYTFSQSGTQKALDKIRTITKKIDPELFRHFEKRGVDFGFFSFKWVFCLLVREFPLRVGLRLFDTYISDEQGFSVLHAYVCSALLLKWSVKLRKMNFTDIMLFLQNMPTKEWSENDLEMLLSESYVFRTLYEGTFNTSSNSPAGTNSQSTNSLP